MNGTKRFCQRRNGAIITGLCQGLAQYTNVDVTFVRVVVLALSFFAPAEVLAIYAVLLLSVPCCDDEIRSSALLDVPLLKRLLVAGNARGLTQYFNELWRSTLVRWNAWMRGTVA